MDGSAAGNVEVEDFDYHEGFFFLGRTQILPEISVIPFAQKLLTSQRDHVNHCKS